MNNATPLVYSRLFLPHPLPADQVSAFLTRLASARDGYPVVLETRADETGIQHLLACDTSYVQRVRRLLRDLIPGTIMVGLPKAWARPTMIAAGHVVPVPAGLPLATEDPMPSIRAVYSALARTHQPGEATCIQLVIGAGMPPKIVPPKVADPTATIWQKLLHGQPDASNELRGRIKLHENSYGMQAVLRIGVAAGNSDKRRRMALESLASLAVAQSPGVRLNFVHEDPNRLNLAPLTRRGVTAFTVPELVTLTTWPIGNEQLPGMPPVHPKMLRADAAAHTGDRVFAQSCVPGDDRQFGVSASDARYHGFALGPTGVGKTTLLEHLMEADINAGHGVVVLDPKDQTPERLLARIPKSRWTDVVYIDPTEKRPLGFNPLDASGRDPDVVADGILAVFQKIFADGWGPRTADIFSSTLRTLARTGTTEHPNTLLDIPRIWTDPEFRRSQVGKVRDDVALMTFWGWYDSLKPGAQLNAIAAPMNKIRQILLRPGAAKILGQPRPGFRLRDVFRDQKIVLIGLNEGLIGPLTAELLGSLIISEVWQAVQERAREKGHEKRLGFVYVDEADRFLHLPVALSDALARSRSLSVGWFLACQYWDQLPKEMKAAVASNARTKVVYRLESDDDARTFARLAPVLQPEDFMALERFQIYVRPVINGVTSDWALAKTLPPSAATVDPDEVRRVSREHHQPDIVTAPSAPNSVATPNSANTLTSAPIGRKRRQR